MTKFDFEQAVEMSRKYFFALAQTSKSPHAFKGVHEAGGFEAGVLTSIGVQRIQDDPDTLVEDARKSVDAFDALRFAAAQQISLGIAIPTSINRWVSAYLQGKLERPMGRDGKPSAEGMRRQIYGAVIRLTEKGMKPTRNNGSPAVSACDAVAEALRELGLSPTTFRGVKNIYMKLNREETGGKFPASFKISKGRVIDTS